VLSYAAAADSARAKRARLGENLPGKVRVSRCGDARGSTLSAPSVPTERLGAGRSRRGERHPTNGAALLRPTPPLSSPRLRSPRPMDIVSGQGRERVDGGGRRCVRQWCRLPPIIRCTRTTSKQGRQLRHHDNYLMSRSTTFPASSCGLIRSSSRGRWVGSGRSCIGPSGDERLQLSQRADYNIEVEVGLETTLKPRHHQHPDERTPMPTSNPRLHVHPRLREPGTVYLAFLKVVRPQLGWTGSRRPAGFDDLRLASRSVRALDHPGPRLRPRCERRRPPHDGSSTCSGTTSGRRITSPRPRRAGRRRERRGHADWGEVLDALTPISLEWRQIGPGQATPSRNSTCWDARRTLNEFRSPFALPWSRCFGYPAAISLSFFPALAPIAPARTLAACRPCGPPSPAFDTCPAPPQRRSRRPPKTKSPAASPRAARTPAPPAGRAGPDAILRRGIALAPKKVVILQGQRQLDSASTP